MNSAEELPREPQDTVNQSVGERILRSVHDEKRGKGCTFEEPCYRAECRWCSEVLHVEGALLCMNPIPEAEDV